MQLYEVLVVPKDASEADIKKAFKKAALRTHPDQGMQGPRASSEGWGVG